MDVSPDIDARLVDGINLFFGQIPFNNELGLEMTYLGLDRVELQLAMKPELVGNFIHGNLHGGVISATLDVAGGMIALVGAYQRTEGMPDEERLRMLTKIGTIDLRVDYLRPGRGRFFTASGRLLRTGNKVAVTRMSFHNESDELQAVGTGTYLCG